MNLLMIYPEFPDTFWSFKHALKFVNKKASSPPLGLLTIASLLPPSWSIKLIDMNVESLAISDIQWADLIFISAMTVQRQSAEKTLQVCKSLAKTIVAGGPLFTSEYENYPQVDHFVLQEAEITLLEFLKDFELNSLKSVYTTEDYCNLSHSPPPRLDLIKPENYNSMAIQFSRGCPYNCDFCNVTALFGHKPRLKTTDQIIAELNQIYNMGWRRNIFFVDDNFIGNKKILIQEVLPALIRWRKGKKGCQFITETTINLADDDRLMDLMVSAGFVSVFVGIETPDEKSLSECGKTHNLKRNLLQSVKKLQNKGLEVMAGFIVGFDNDKPDIFQKQINFIQQSGIATAMVGLLQAPNGTSLFDRLKKEGRLVESFSGDNSDGFTNIKPMMDADVLRKGYLEVISTIYDPSNYYQRIITFLREFKSRRNMNMLQLDDLRAFFRSIICLGIIGTERLQYWRLLLWSIIHCPQKFPTAVTLAIYGYHFRLISQAQLADRTI